MKYLKMLGLAVVAAMALAAFLGAGTASATVLCKEANTTENCIEKNKEYPAGTVIEATLVGGTAILEREKLDKTWEINDTCTGSTLEGKTNNRGGAGEAVTGKVEKLNWAGCTKATATATLGELEISWINGTDNGTVTAKGTEVTVNTIFGSCFFGPGKAGSVDLGTLVGSATTPQLVITANVPYLSGPCPSGSTYRWTAEYHVTNPKNLFVSNK